MKLDEFVIKKADRNVREFIDQVTLILNFGKYSAQTLTSPPQWVARNGEFAFFQSSTTSGNRVYFYANNQWNWFSGSPNGGTPVDASYIVLEANSTLTNERVLVAGSNVTLVDGGVANSSLTISVAPGGVYPQVQIVSNGLFYADSGFQYVTNSAVLVKAGMDVVFNSDTGANTRMVYNTSNTYLEYYLNGEIRLQM